MKTDFDILIIGAGLVGLTTALACAESGASVAILDRNAIETGHDGRASALSTSSLRLFENLGVDLSNALQPIQDMLVTEGIPNSPWRLHFEGDGDGGDLGAVIENPILKSALLDTLKNAAGVESFAPANIIEFDIQEDGVTLETDIGQFTGQLLVAADGRNSVLRRKSGLTVQRFDYDAASLVTTISHDLPHDGLAWQRIIKGGALAVLPLTGQRSQIVWSGPTQAIKAAEQLPDAAFLDLLSEKMEAYLGEMQLLTTRRSYPLRLQIADQFSHKRLALVGDAAHIIHPLAGQGLNLGLRDAAALADGVSMARETGQDIGTASLLDYDLWRNTDTRLLGALTHLISESSGSKLGSVGHARRLGLALTNRSSTLKRNLGKRAAGESQNMPKLMQSQL